MANMCNFEMRVKGRRVDIETFFKAMSQVGHYIMGRGADADINYDDNDPDTSASIYGWCKWSVYSAMVDNAIDMRENPDNWCWGDDEERDPNPEYITLWEACKKWNLDMEVYSCEPGCEFQEHYMVVDGDIVCDECEEYHEYWIADYETLEEAEEELDIEITDEEWEAREFNDVIRGGFEEWSFDI